MSTVRHRSASGRHHGLTGAAVVAAGLLAVGLLAVGCTGHGDSPGGGPSTRRPAQSHVGSRPVAVTGPRTLRATLPAADAAARRVTEHAVARLLATAPAPPDASPATRSPVAALDDAPFVPASPDVVTRTRWWTVPGRPSAVLTFFSTHVPAGLRLSGTQQVGITDVQLRGLSLAASGARRRAPGVYSDLQLLVTVTELGNGNGVAVRVDAQALWLPQRTAAEHIPSRVTTVDVVVERNGRAATVRRTLGRHDARSLAALVDALPVFLPGPISCPLSRGFHDELTFRGAGTPLRVGIQPDGCSVVTVARPGPLRPALHGGRSIDRAVLRALGLPAGYGT